MWYQMVPTFGIITACLAAPTYIGWAAYYYLRDGRVSKVCAARPSHLCNLVRSIHSIDE